MKKIEEGDVVYFNNEEGWTRGEKSEKNFVNGKQYSVSIVYKVTNVNVIAKFGESNLVCLETLDRNLLKESTWFPARLVSFNQPSDLPTRLSKKQKRKSSI